MNKNYLLVSSVYNEERYIENTIKSVVNQTLRPVEWIVVSDASTDRTDEIVKHYSSQYPFITFLRFENKEVIRSKFGRVAKRKTAAINAGLKVKKRNDHEFIGNLDGDVTFKEDYYEKLIDKFASNSRLGLAGGFIYNIEGDRKWGNFTNPQGVGGAIQFFRRQCWEEIGGYYPGGHEDYFAGIGCRMCNWKTQAFPDLEVLHHKHPEALNISMLHVTFYLGQMDYICGEMFLYACARAIQILPEKPIIILSILRIMGYLSLAIKREPVQLPPQYKKFMRKLQIDKLKSIIFRRG